jgi:hypothetical protein
MPDLSGRPLLATRRDAERFVGHQQAARVLTDAIEHDYNVAVFGRRGSGKSSLLHFADHSLRDRRRMVFIDASVVGDPASLLQLVRFRLGLAPTPAETVRDSFSGMFRPQRPPTDVSDLLYVLEALRADSEADEDPTPMTLLVDDLDPHVGNTVFGRLRNELWSLRYRWVVAAEEDARQALLTAPADSFFDVVIELEPLSIAELVELLKARADGETIDEDLAREVAELADGNPRRLLALAREAILGGVGADDLAATRARLIERIENLSPSARMLFEELEVRGQASASDENLLKRFSWSRQRARRVFEELEQAGLVVAQSERGQRPGRPRKVYVLADRAAA